MQFSNFLFPESKLPETDSSVIDETLREAELCDTLGLTCSGWRSTILMAAVLMLILDLAAAIAARTGISASALQWPRWRCIIRSG